MEIIFLKIEIENIEWLKWFLRAGLIYGLKYVDLGCKF